MFQVANLTLASTWNNLLTKKRISLPKTYVLPTFRQIPQRKDILIWPWNYSYDLVAKEEDGYITDKKLVSLVTRTARTLKRKHRRSWSFITSKIRNKSDENRIYNIPKLSLDKKQKNGEYIWNIKHSVYRQLVPLSSFTWCFLFV